MATGARELTTVPPGRESAGTREPAISASPPPTAAAATSSSPLEQPDQRGIRAQQHGRLLDDLVEHRSGLELAREEAAGVGQLLGEQPRAPLDLEELAAGERRLRALGELARQVEVVVGEGSLLAEEDERERAPLECAGGRAGSRAATRRRPRRGTTGRSARRPPARSRRSSRPRRRRARAPPPRRAARRRTPRGASRAGCGRRRAGSPRAPASAPRPRRRRTPRSPRARRPRASRTATRARRAGWRSARTRSRRAPAARAPRSSRRSAGPARRAVANVVSTSASASVKVRLPVARADADHASRLAGPGHRRDHRGDEVAVGRVRHRVGDPLVGLLHGRVPLVDRPPGETLGRRELEADERLVEAVHGGAAEHPAVRARRGSSRRRRPRAGR